jgi:RimJ/RimL family protein N-acetyltransferase
MKLQTNRLLLRPISLEDKEAVFAYRSNKEDNKYQGWIPEKLSDVEEFIGKVAKQLDEPDSWFQLVIIEQGSGLVIGDLGIHFCGDENKQAELGCTLNREFWRKGYATEAMKKAIDFLFNDLDKHRVFASIYPENSASIGLVERMGFRKEAHFVQSLYIDGKWVDDMVYALLRSEWDG